MSGGYGSGGGRGTGGGTGGYPGPGYGGAEYGDDGTPRASGEPRWDDSVWQRDQPDTWASQDADPSRGTPQGYDPQGYDPRGYNGQGYGGQDYDGAGYAGQGVPSGPQWYPRTGPQPVQPGSGAYPAQPGQRGSGTGPRPVTGGSGGQRIVGGYDEPARDDRGASEFLPGFGRRDDFEGGRGQDRAPRGRGGGRGRDVGRGQGPDQGGYDQYAAYDDPRANRGPATDPASRRDVREQPVRPDAGRQEGRRADGRAPNGPDLRPRDPSRAGQGNGNGRGNGYDRDDRQPRRRRRSPIRRLAPWIALLVIVVPLALGGWHIYGIWKAKTHPADYVGSGTTPKVAVQVLPDEVAGQLASTLVADGVVASTRAFVLAAENSSDPAGLEPGYFLLNHHMQASLAWAALLNPKNRDQFTVTIPEGKRSTQVIATLAKDTKIPLKDFQQVIDHPAQLGLPSYAKGVAGFPYSAVEGFLFPATYVITPHETALQILQAMVTRYNQEAQSVDLTAAAKAVGLTADQVIIEASMAQAEGGSVSDYPKVAEVITNRLKDNGDFPTLGLDSALQYGLNLTGDVNVTDAQEQKRNPWNDMVSPPIGHVGLPPTPISNPGNAAIEGILHPDHGNYTWFLTVTGGTTIFSNHCIRSECP